MRYDESRYQNVPNRDQPDFGDGLSDDIADSTVHCGPSEPNLIGLPPGRGVIISIYRRINVPFLEITKIS